MPCGPIRPSRPKPDVYFLDTTGRVTGADWRPINEKLAQFERDTSNQIVVVMYAALPPGADLAQYCTQVYNAWGIGQKSANGGNGAVLFVFVDDHKMFIATGRGLEGALPDITCQQILDNQVRPLFREGDFAAGINAGVDAMIAATRGEYKGTGVTDRERRDAQAAPAPAGSHHRHRHRPVRAHLHPAQLFPGKRWAGLISIPAAGLVAAGLAGDLVAEEADSAAGGGGGGGGFSGGGGGSAGGGAGGSW